MDRPIDVLAMSDVEFAAYERESIQLETTLCPECPDPGLCLAERDCCAGGGPE